MKKPEKYDDSKDINTDWEDGVCHGRNFTIDDFNNWLKSDECKEDVGRLIFEMMRQGCNSHEIANAISDRLGEK